MLSLIGDILNWAAAGIVFPLMFLPLAALIFEPAGARPPVMRMGAAPWALSVLAVAGAGYLFVRLAPDLGGRLPARAGLIFAVLVALETAAIAFAGGPRRAAERLAPLFETITRTAGRLVMWLILAMALVQFAVVILRYVFGLSFIAMQESITYMHGAVFLLAAGYALLTDDHVRVDIFYRGASPRKKALIDFAGTYFLLFPVTLLILWTASGYVGSSWSVGEGSQEQSGVQAVFIVKSMIPAFALLMAMAGFVNAARAGEELKGRT
jgi:TRAP-type mannitol/chloroaromatic compound transport system permease small subunit